MCEPHLSVLKVEGKRQRQTQSKPKHKETKTQSQTHQPKGYELQDYLFKYIVEESCVIYNESMNDVNEKHSYMTVYVTTISGKTISISCDRRQSISRIKHEIERKTKTPKILQHLSNEGKTSSERKTIQEHNIMNEATLEMTLGLQGGTEEDETMTSAGSAEERNMRRKHSEIGEIQLSDDTEHIKREVFNASRRSKKNRKAYCRNFKEVR